MLTVYAARTQTGWTRHMKGHESMGKRVIVEHYDDLEPELAADTERLFAVNGIHYRIDLSNKNAAKFDKDMEKWVTAAERVSKPSEGTRRRGRASRPGADAGLPLGEIRAWAKDNGYEISDRGRVAAEIVRAWKAATQGDQATETA